MSIYLAESFDGVANATQFNNNLTQGGRWGAFISNTSFTLSGTNSRTGNNLEAATTSCCPAISLADTTFNDSSVQDEEIYVGFAFRTPSLPASGFRGIVGIQGSNGGNMNGVVYTSTGALELIRAASTGISATNAGVIQVNTWQYIEWYLKRSDSNGRHVVRVNDVIVHDFTGDTFNNNQTPSFPPYLSLGNINPLNTNTAPAIVGAKWDDLYIVSVDGVGQNGFCGTSYVPCLRPNGNGVSSQWVGSDANSTDNYQLIDEQSINDADFVEATNNGDRDTYPHETYDVPAGQAILSVQTNARAAYLSTARDLGFVARLDDGTTEVKERSLSNAIVLRWKNFETKPGGGNWPEDEFNDAEFGFEQAAV